MVAKLFADPALLGLLGMLGVGWGRAGLPWNSLGCAGILSDAVLCWGFWNGLSVAARLVRFDQGWAGSDERSAGQGLCQSIFGCLAGILEGKLLEAEVCQHKQNLNKIPDSVMRLLVDVV